MKDLIFKIDFGTDWDIVQAPDNGEWNLKTIKEWFTSIVSDDGSEELVVELLTKKEQRKIKVTFEEDKELKLNLFEFAVMNYPIGQPWIIVSTNY